MAGPYIKEAGKEFQSYEKSSWWNKQEQEEEILIYHGFKKDILCFRNMTHSMWRNDLRGSKIEGDRIQGRDDGQSFRKLRQWRRSDGFQKYFKWMKNQVF